VSKLLNDEGWDVLLRRLKQGRCTPFLGAGAAYGVLPLGGDIAKQWADKYAYPMEDRSNLIAVSQFLALKYDSVYPKELIVEMFEKFAEPDFNDANEPHRVLANLDLPVYVTTNYDDFMVKALVRHHREPNRVLCKWNRALNDQSTIFEQNPAYVPTTANPVVFHLHGHVPIAESLVLTEDDYMEFLLNFSNDSKLIPNAILKAFIDNSLLFIGYRITDWNFRVLLRSFDRRGGSARLNVAVMPAPKGADEGKTQDYLTKYYENIDVRVYWGTAREFLADLWTRWEKAGYAN
jgi:hypothetical protein